MTRKIHNLLRKARFVKCRNPCHHERGYTLKHHKNAALIQVYFDSFELLDEADRVLQSQGIKGVKSLPDKAEGCFLSILLNQEPSS
ncbi:hypothetical protein QUA41_17815 [Microcoleus sp. Pol11C1]|uniref:hypothetical protein n=1 Tax=unclassified Microcoleus TaxID=2642155 RepID=UPI002FD2B21E